MFNDFSLDWTAEVWLESKSNMADFSKMAKFSSDERIKIELNEALYVFGRHYEGRTISIQRVFEKRLQLVKFSASVGIKIHFTRHWLQINFDDQRNNFAKFFLAIKCCLKRLIDEVGHRKKHQRSCVELSMVHFLFTFLCAQFIAVESFFFIIL